MITFVRSDGEPGSVPLALLHGSDGTVQFDVYEDDQPLVASSATIDIGLVVDDDTPGNADHYVDGASMTVGAGPEGSNNRLTYTFASGSHPTDPEKDITVVLTVTTSDSRTVKHRTMLDLLFVVPQMTVREEDLFVRLPRLRDHRALGIEEGQASSGSTTTLVAAGLKQYPSGYYKGGEVEILDGANEGTWREITAHDGSTGTITVADAWPGAIQTSSRYRVRRSWEPLIVEAWVEIRRQTRRMGWGLYDVTDPQQLREPHMLLSIAYALEAMGSETEMAMSETYRKRYTTLLDDVEVNLSAPDTHQPSGAVSRASQVVEVGRR